MAVTLIENIKRMKIRLPAANSRHCILGKAILPRSIVIVTKYRQKFKKCGGSFEKA
jgi:hypothetical protein